MTLLKGLSAVVAFVALSLGYAAGAHAQATRTWVSGVGDDANPCSRTAPCKTFAGAISKTAITGEIDCLDPGGFGTVTVTKSITIDCGGGMSGQAGGIASSGVNGIVVNIPSATATDRVVIRNMVINGFGTGLAGIKVIAAGALTVEHVMIINVGVSPNPAIDVRPTGFATRLYVRDVEIHHPATSGFNISNANATLENVFISGPGAIGVQVGDGGVVNLVNTRIANSGGKGVLISALTSTASVNLDDVTITKSVGEAVFANGSFATLRLSNSSLFENTTAIQATNSAIVQTFGNNRLAGNTSPGVTPTLVLQQ